MRRRLVATLLGMACLGVGCGLITVDPDALQASTPDAGDLSDASSTFDGSPADGAAEGRTDADDAAHDGGCSQPTAESGWLTGSEPGGDWTQPENAFVTDGLTAMTQIQDISGALAVAAFGANVPPGAVVRGVSVEIVRSADGSIRDDGVFLMNPLGGVGEDRRSMTEWPMVATAAVYGGPTDSWGLPLSPIVANARSLAVILHVRTPADGGYDGAPPSDCCRARVDSIRIKFHYCP